MTNSANLKAGWCSEFECKTTLKRVFDEHRYCLDPHTAVAVNVAERCRTSTAIPVTFAYFFPMPNLLRSDGLEYGLEKVEDIIQQ